MAERSVGVLPGVDGAPAKDPEGRELGALFVAGQRSPGAAEVALSPPEVWGAASNLANGIVSVPRADMPRGSVGAVNMTTGQVKLIRGLPEQAIDDTLAHELGHVVRRETLAPWENLALPPRVAREMAGVSAKRNGEEWLTDAGRAYFRQPEELFAEACRLISERDAKARG